VQLRGAPAGPAVTHISQNNQFRDMELSPDNKKITFAAHGEIFAISAKDGGSASRVTNTPAAESDATWAPDSKRVAYVSDRDGNYHIYVYDFASGSETRITNDPGGETSPQWSPDGKLISFVRGGKQIWVYDPDSKQERKLAEGIFGRPALGPIKWSPDSQWMAYTAPGERQFRNVYVVPAAGGTARAISFVPNTYTNSIAWSPDGTYLLFASGQRTEPGSVIRVELVPKTPKFREDLFRDLFKEELPARPATQPAPPAAQVKASASEEKAGTASAEAKKKAPPKVVIEFEGIRRRAHVLPIGLDAGALSISPDGKTLLFTSSVAGQQNLYTYSLDELAKEPAVARQLTSTPGFKSGAQWSSDSKTVYYLESGRMQSIAVESRQAKPIAATAELDVDFSKEKMEVFAQAWRYLNDNFYDPEFHGVDWKAARARFEPQIAGARTPDEMRRIISLMLGELDASHLGISAGGGAGTGGGPSTGKAGLRFDRNEYESNGHFKISEVLNLSPADVAGIQAGEYLVAVDGTALAAATNADELMGHKVGKRVVLTVAKSAAGDAQRDVPVSPISTSAEKQLAYRQWVEGRREYVAKISGGRLGYVHMPDMSSNSLQQLYLDLDTENQAKEGVVIDIRSNNGGFVNAYALDVLTRRPYLNMAPRDLPPAPARSVLGQRALERPTVLITNMESLSDAEDFTEGYRTLKLGKVVGEPTAGWIIYTGGVQLIDGSVLRLPSTRITTEQGVTMERNPRPVDVAVARPVGESYTGKDAQLEAAVKELLGEIDRGKRGGAKVAAR
jgi:tricorn protease